MSIIERYKELNRQKKEIEKEMDILKKALLCDEDNFKWVDRESFDAKAFKVEHPELHSQFVKTTQYKKLTI
jgi:predicted phage-related endonuclease